MSRWIHELAIPGRPDVSSVHASYAFAAVVLVGLVLARLTTFWPWFTLAMLAFLLQLRLQVGIVLAKLRATLPPPVGHAEMFPEPQPLKNISWLRACGGFLASIALIAAYALSERSFPT